MTLAELIEELDRRAAEQRQCGVDIMREDLPLETAVQSSLQFDAAAEAYQAAAELARQVEQ